MNSASAAFLSLFGFWALVCGGAHADDAFRAEIEVDSAEVAFESKILLNLLVEWQSDLVAPSPDIAPEPKLKRLKLVGLTTRTEPFVRDQVNYLRREYHYTLQPTSEGKGLIEPFEIGYIRLVDSSAGSVATDGAEVSIQSPVIQPADEPNHTLWLAGGLVLLIGAIVVALLKRRARSDQGEAQDPLERRLAQLKSLTAQPRSKFYAELFQLLDDTLRERGITAARPGDSHGMIADIEVSALPGALRSKLIHWVEESARQKFAPAGGTPGDTLRLYFEVESALREPWPAGETTQEDSQERRQRSG